MTAGFRPTGTDTLVLHGGGFRHDPATSATTVPIYQSTAFDFPETATAIKIINFAVPEWRRSAHSSGRARLRKINNFLPNQIGSYMVFQKARRPPSLPL
jgi:hypothetical protein